jgi:hypothetical protein
MWILELCIIVVIIYFQIKTYVNTRALLAKFRNIFPENTKEVYTIKNDCIVCLNSKSNDVSKTIFSSVNTYLQNNRNSKADFYLIKDIVDRNCDSAEEEISTRVPVPLYCGLAGTMLGIIIGVGSLWISGDLSSLLNASLEDVQGSGGIENLLVGVALAMSSSLVGVVLTTWCSWNVKDAKKEHEKNKHGFLSWVQAKLLPILTTDAMSAISKMTENLASFNDAFAQNTEDLKLALTEINKATEGQTELFATIRKIHFKEVVTANIEVYEKLKGCTEEIGLIGEQLKASRQYLQKVTALTDKLDVTEKRTQLIEEMSNYFIKERSNLDAMSGVISHSIGEADSNLHKASEELKDSISNQYTQLAEHMNKQREKFEEVANEQTKTMTQATQTRIEVFDTLSENLNTVTKDLSTISTDLSSLTQELKQLGSVHTDIESLVSSLKSQNDKIDKLVSTLNQRSYPIAPRNAFTQPENHIEIQEKPMPNNVFWSRLFKRNK